MHVEVFDAGERSAQGDVGTEGEDEDAHHPAVEVGGQDFEVAGLDESPEFLEEWLRNRLAVPEPFLQQSQGFSEAHAGDT
jgi:hypothetical protein